MKPVIICGALAIAVTCAPAFGQRASVPSSAAPPRNLALIGVTRVGDLAKAWLVDLDSNRRETAGPGGLAFGYRVKQVGDDRVVLTRSGRQFVLKLGDRDVPVREAPVPMEIPVVEPDRSGAPPMVESGSLPAPAATAPQPEPPPPPAPAEPARPQVPSYAYVPGYGYVPLPGPNEPGYGYPPYGLPLDFEPSSGPYSSPSSLPRAAPRRSNPQTGRRTGGSFFGGGVSPNPQTQRRRSR